MGRRSAAALLFIAALVRSGTADASPLDVYGFGDRGAAMGGALTADAQGVEALYYNVGALTLGEEGFVFGIMTNLDDARIALSDRPAGYEIPDLGVATPTVPSADTIHERSHTEGISRFTGVRLGGAVSVFTEDLRFGAMVFLPASGGGMQDSWFPDERERLFSNRLHWELIDTRLHRPVVEAGLAYRPTDRVSLGVGGSYVPAVTSNTDVYVANPTEFGDSTINLHSTQEASWALLAGVLLEATDTLRVGLAFRDALAFRVQGANSIQARGIEEGADDWPIEQPLDFNPAETPRLVAFGVAIDAGRLTMTADARYTFWSAYRNSHNQPTDFDDTLSNRLGLEFRRSPRTRMWSGVAWEPTPVPEQTGRTNYVDNARFVFAAGAGHRFAFRERSFELSWHAQAHILRGRETEKGVLVDYPDCDAETESLCDELSDELSDVRTGEPIPGTAGLQTGNPGFPGFSSGGWFASVGIGLAWYPGLDPTSLRSEARR